MKKLIKINCKYYAVCFLQMLPIKNSKNKNKSYNLYLMSNEPVKTGDYIIESFGHNDPHILFKSDKDDNDGTKVIASTNNSLGLPLISDEFYDYIISIYNNNHIINKVLVEYIDKSGFFHQHDYKLKLNINNTVNILPFDINKSYNFLTIYDILNNYTSYLLNNIIHIDHFGDDIEFEYILSSEFNLIEFMKSNLN
jgi:hypothetical protein